jgi:hypothetical protein
MFASRDAYQAGMARPTGVVRVADVPGADVPPWFTSTPNPYRREGGHAN